MTSKRFENDLREQLQDPKFASAYIRAAMDDDAAAGGIDGLLHAVREIALSQQGGITATAHQAKMGRQTVYDGFKKGGNPQIRTVDGILRSIGMQLTVKDRREGVQP